MKTRKQFDQPLSANQNVQFELAKMATDLEASRLMVRHGANCLDNLEPNYTMQCAMAKKFATDKCFDIVNNAL